MMKITPKQAFWGAIIIAFIGTITLVAVAWWQQSRSGPGFDRAARDAGPAITPDVLRRILSEAQDSALIDVETNALEPALDLIFNPVLDAIPAYADFHYSVLGEYTELLGAALGEAEEAMEKRLFGGFNERVTAASARLDQQLLDSYGAAVADNLQGFGLQVRPMIAMVQDDAKARFRVTAPVGALLVGATSGLGKAAAKVIAKKIGAKIAMKSAAKAASKWAATTTSAGLGTLACSWAGPGAVVCGGVAGLFTWFAVDAVVITIDEYFTRDEFEVDLAAMVTEVRRDLRDDLLAALNERAQTLTGPPPPPQSFSDQLSAD